MPSLTRPAIRRTLGATASAGLVIGLLAACGSGNTASAADNSATTNNSAGASTGTGAGGGTGRGFPGVNGQIAAVSGKTLQVQGSNSQTAVTYTTSTALTQVVSAAESALAVGKCVSVTPVASTDTSATGSTGAADTSTPITAASVSISDPVNGSCSTFGGTGGGFGGRPAGATGATGSFTPPAGASGATGATGARGGRGGFGGANGTVASISGDTMTVTMTRPAAATGATGASAITTSTRTVTLTSSTTYTKSEKAADSALTVGKCVSAQGTTDSTTGALTANSITIRPATDGTCSTGLGGGAGGPGAGTDPSATAANN
jgi:hypothetical protein